MFVADAAAAAAELARFGRGIVIVVMGVIGRIDGVGEVGVGDVDARVDDRHPHRRIAQTDGIERVHAELFQVPLAGVVRVVEVGGHMVDAHIGKGQHAGLAIQELGQRDRRRGVHHRHPPGPPAQPARAIRRRDIGVQMHENTGQHVKGEATDVVAIRHGRDWRGRVLGVQAQAGKSRGDDQPQDRDLHDRSGNA